MGTPLVHTVLGPIPPTSLGPTLMHEHVLCDFYRVTGNLDHILNDEDLAVLELTRLRDAGGAALVECTPFDLGRNALALRRIARRTGLHIIMGTGWYRQPFDPPEIDRMTVAALTERMIADLRGAGQDAVPAGIIGEIGAHADYLTAQEERVLRVAARAQRLTGAPVTTHASMYPVGLQQLALLREEGVDPGHVIIGHCDTYRSDLHAFGGPGYDVVFRRFFDLLRARGVDEDDWSMMTVENPRRVLAW